MTDETKKNALAVQDAASLPAEFLADLEADAGKGGEVTTKDLATPFISILQSGSPQVKRKDEKYVEGAQEGFIFDNTTQLAIDGDVGIEVIPCFFEPAEVEWRPDRGGFVQKHPADTPLKSQVRPVANDDGKVELKLPNGNILTETKYFYCWYRPRVAEGEPNPYSWEMGVIGMSSSMIKCAREWNGMRQRTKLPSGAKAPFYAKVYVLKTQYVKKGENSWYIWSITQDRWVDAKELAAARELSEQAAAGTLKVAEPTDAADSNSAPAGLDEEVL